MYKAAAGIIFVIIAALIILVSVSTIRHATGADETTADTTPLFAEHGAGNDEDSAETAVDTTAVSDVQTESIDNPDTTPAVTSPAVTAAPADYTPVAEPTKNSTDEWEKFLSEYPDTVLGSTDDAGPDYIGKIVFLGDSTTYGLRAYKMLDGGRDTTQVWTPASGTLTLSQVSFAKIVYPETGAELTIKEAAAAKQPEYLVITLGVNGVSFMDEEYFKSEYKKMIESIAEASPDTKIICQSMFPVARTYEHLNSINNDKIRAANHWIVEVANEVGVKFVDTYSVLCDSEGWLPEEYHNGDGMHLNSTSFTLELDNLRTHAYITE